MSMIQMLLNEMEQEAETTRNTLSRVPDDKRSRWPRVEIN